jgi:hypothetical protein
MEEIFFVNVLLHLPWLQKLVFGEVVLEHLRGMFHNDYEAINEYIKTKKLRQTKNLVLNFISGIKR